jgi:hypothetical protein
MDMTLPEPLKKSIERKLTQHCDEKVPENVRNLSRLKFFISGNTVILYEERPSVAFPSRWVEIYVAQFRYSTKTEKWTLYWAEENYKWHVYPECNPKKEFDDLLIEVDKDPTGIFGGVENDTDKHFPENRNRK